ncbi:putative norsolorinic acid reductase protein [Phaeoacremonium minimum UCRPA7]|uniref:Putative norsolorinic acid reductase protein n=1 Tax=Phaeoacremonium minimum (strain UCR-PA7) TaxID=1286976 RepID=R8BXP4_PHAM7|nr:putative norsolorinic acid reductase protein [Phaeoacremonium minimum UCRPA7]EOO04049.1 putative norsolorinic acid reductase protein [Phaeoacremonium minimum UCRPA7]
MGECTKETAFEILDTFKELGGNFIDTANGYQDGESELWLGEWMTSRKNRDELVLATKYSGTCIPHMKDKVQANFCGNGTKSMRLSVESSLERLQTSYVDLLYVHWWDYATPIPELMRSLNALVESGKVNYLGISDTPAWVVAKANQYARDHGFAPFVVYQGLWNASIRDFERDIIPMCKDEGMGLVPYGTLGQGCFQTEAAFKERQVNNPGRQKKPKRNERAISKVLEALSNEKNTRLTGVAMAYVMNKAPYVFPLVGCRTSEQLKSNVEALNIDLNDDEIAEIENAYYFDPGFPHTFLSGTLFNNDDTVQEVPHGPGDVWLTNAITNIDWVEPSKPIKPVHS